VIYEPRQRMQALRKHLTVSREAVPSLPNFLLCDFFDARGNRVERIFICLEEGQEAADRLRTAINAFLQEVAGQRLPLQQAKTVTSIRVDFRGPVTIQQTLPALEKAFGGYAISWARGTFKPLKLGSPYLH
jgi:hypothetical protein